jgi:CRISPR system Cascade subunit CasB
MSDQQTSRCPLIDYLESLAAREDRATLAALRASLRPGRELEGLRVVLPFLRSNAGRREEDDAVLVAGLFALHPERGTSTLPEALRQVQLATNSDSVERRFLSLMESGRDELSTHLRYGIALVASRKVGIDWADLYRAIKYWDHPDDFIRREWARSFWATEALYEPPSAPTATNT